MGVLPKIETPEYTTKLPVSGMQVKFRPYLVKEEKLIMIATQSGDRNEQLNAMLNIIGMCVKTKDFDVNSLAMADVDWLFLKLRSKSVGEEIEQDVKCPHCKATTPIAIDLEKIKCSKTKVATEKIMITDTIGINISAPTVKMLRKYDMNKIEGVDNDVVEGINFGCELIIDCIQSVFDGDSYHNTEDVSREEMNEFIDSLGSQQFSKIKNFFDEMPTVEYDEKETCVACKKEIEIKLTGMSDFFVSPSAKDHLKVITE